MITHPPESRMALGGALLAFLLPLVALIAAGCNEEAVKQPLAATLDRFDAQIAGIENGEATHLNLLSVNNVDVRLKSVSGLKKVTFVNLHGPTDMTDAGIKQLATFPDLTTVGIFDLNVPATWPKLLQACPGLERVWLQPNQPLEFEIADFLAMPTLREIYLNVLVDPDKPDADESEKWLDSTLSNLKTATHLKAIKLVGEGFVRRKATVAEIAQDLPGCKVLLFLSPLEELQGQLTPLADDGDTPDDSR